MTTNLITTVKNNEFQKLKQLTTQFMKIKDEYTSWYDSVGIRGLTQEEWNTKFSAMTDEEKKVLLEKDIYYKHNISIFEQHIVRASVELCQHQ